MTIIKGNVPAAIKIPFNSVIQNWFKDPLNSKKILPNIMQNKLDNIANKILTMKITVIFDKTICLLVTGIVLRDLNVLLSLSTKKIMVAIIPNKAGNKNCIPNPTVLIHSSLYSSALFSYLAIIDGVFSRKESDNGNNIEASNTK